MKLSEIKKFKETSDVRKVAKTAQCGKSTVYAFLRNTRNQNSRTNQRIKRAFIKIIHHRQKLERELVAEK